MLRKLIYVSGPITKGNQFRNVQKGIDAFNQCLDVGIAAVCPHFTAFAHMTRERTHSEWMKVDLEAILPRCNAVWRLPGESIGADLECREAERLGIPVFQSFTDLLHWHQANGQEDAKHLVTEGAI